MRFDKLIFVRYLPLTKKITEDFYFEEIRSSGVSVEYWDVSFIMEGVSQIETYDNNFVRRFVSYKELKKELRSIDRTNSLFVLIMTYNGDLLRLYSLFSRFHCKLSVFGKNMFPLPEFSKTSVIKSSVMSFRLAKKLFLNRLSVAAKKYHFVKGYDILFLAGNKGVYGIGRVSPEEVSNAEIVRINSDDYDRSISNHTLSNVSKYGDHYAVFLDEYLPLHQDLEIVGMKSIDADTYYKSLNNTFRLFEEKYGVSVIIAAHPKAVRYRTEDFFEGREVIWGDTLELCRSCDFILAHDSTSINYAIINKKPIISLISNDIYMTSPLIADSINAFSSYLKTPLINIDNPDLENLSLEVNEDSYASYKYDFLTSSVSEGVHTSRILIDYLTSDK